MKKYFLLYLFTLLLPFNVFAATQFDGKNIKNGSIDLETKVKNVLPVANGGTGSNTGLSTTAVTEGTNLYFTVARVLGVYLTGFTATNSVVTSSDTILSAFGKLQGQLSGLATVATSGSYADLSNKPSIPTTTASIEPSTNRNYVTDAQQTVIGNTSGTNSGDETDTTIKTKLGITTLSGSNTGDQDLSGLMVKSSNLSDLTNTTTARTNLGLAIGSNVQAYSADTVLTSNVNAFSKQQTITPQTLTSSSNLTAWDTTNGNVAIYSAVENSTLSNPTNLVTGGVYTLIFIQNASVAKTLAYGAQWKFSSGINTVSATLSAVSIINCIYDGTNLNCNISTNFS